MNTTVRDWTSIAADVEEKALVDELRALSTTRHRKQLRKVRRALRSRGLSVKPGPR